jgi:hypothetical protein
MPSSNRHVYAFFSKVSISSINKVDGSSTQKRFYSADKGVSTDDLVILEKVTSNPSTILKEDKNIYLSQAFKDTYSDGLDSNSPFALVNRFFF